jgi:hypothetical protein
VAPLVRLLVAAGAAAGADASRSPQESGEASAPLPCVGLAAAWLSLLEALLARQPPPEGATDAAACVAVELFSGAWAVGGALGSAQRARFGLWLRERLQGEVAALPSGRAALAEMLRDPFGFGLTPEGMPLPWLELKPRGLADVTATTAQPLHGALAVVPTEAATCTRALLALLCKSSSSRGVQLVGPTGVGKSRFARDLSHRLSGAPEWHLSSARASASASSLCGELAAQSRGALSARRRSAPLARRRLLARGAASRTRSGRRRTLERRRTREQRPRGRRCLAQ